MKVLYSEEMQALDRLSINEGGIPSIVLMENASRATASVIKRDLPPEKYPLVAVVAGTGNNGGDGLACSRILHQMGYESRTFIIGEPDKLKTDPSINYNILRKLGMSVESCKSTTELENFIIGCKGRELIIVDALFGTGMSKPVKEGLFEETIELINRSEATVVSVDIPSGLSDQFLPEEGTHIYADITVTFQHLKVAHIYPDGNQFCGKIEVVDIGLPDQYLRSGCTTMITPSAFGSVGDRVAVDSHKGSFGHVLTIAGSPDKPGAGILCSAAALKSGAGLCTAALSKEQSSDVVSRYPELMIKRYSSAKELFDDADFSTVTLIGPGLGTGVNTFDLLSAAITRTENVLVIDADGLNALANCKDFLQHAPGRIILTPHPGEFSRLLGVDSSEIRKNRIGLARDFARKYCVILVLKGHHTVVAMPDGTVSLNSTGNPGMATAGSGDVLAGVIAGMVARYGTADNLGEIVKRAVFMHGYAGDIGLETKGVEGLTATDILNNLSEAFLKEDEFKIKI